MTTTITAQDFKIRKTGPVYYVWQRIGTSFERLSEPHPSRDAARDWITTTVANGERSPSIPAPASR